MFNFNEDFMKRLSLFFVVALICSFVNAQDVITKKNGEDINAKIIEVGTTEVRYKQADNLNGPTFVLNKSEILMIRYENGSKEIFSNTNNVNTPNRQMGYNQYNNGMYYGMSSYFTPRPGMRYKDYSGFYRVSAYQHMPGDRYSPALSGVCSFLIPGLGQMVSGEVGRGLGWFLGSVAIYTLGSIWLTNAEEAGAAIAGAVVFPVSLFTVEICNIVDAVRVAKKKNMYLRDIQNMSSVSLNMSPYFSLNDNVPGSNQKNPTIGLKLNLNF